MRKFPQKADARCAPLGKTEMEPTRRGGKEQKDKEKEGKRKKGQSCSVKEWEEKYGKTRDVT